MVCLSGKNHTCRVAAEADVMAVHLLGGHQRALAELFGTETGDDTDKLARCPWTEGPGGVPLLDDCPNRFVGRIVDRVPLGDHVGHVVEVVEAHASGAVGPLLTFQAVRDVDPGHEA